MLKTLIPLIDMRGKSPVDLLRAYPDKAQALVWAARHRLGTWGRLVSRPAMAWADKRAHGWLKGTRDPYLYEIESFADILAAPGIVKLNAGDEWSGTGGVYRTGEHVTMLRVLDWPFPAMGKHVMVIMQQGRAGDFYNISWPGVSGVYTAMAPGRFGAALNQAPARRYKLGRIGDALVNRFMLHRSRGMTPAHALRQVFEQAEHYEAAKHMLATIPLSQPAIFMLSGTKAGQGCVIERLEDSGEVKELAAGQGVIASNHFSGRLAFVGKGWRPRAEDSDARWRQCSSIHGHDLRVPHFDWLQAPVINRFTRLCVLAEAATGKLLVQGYEGPAQVTELFSMIPEPIGANDTGAWDAMDELMPAYADMEIM